ncbi:MAG: DUF1223 domain-containing protein [Pseudomonadota bacterium]
MTQSTRWALLAKRFLMVGSLWLGAGGFAPLAADDHGPVVVELFTSQGCSSCPPADALLHDLALRDDVLPLALHVDYWDYIGWKDVFARPEHTVRQKAYARAAGERMIYTPQIIIAGLDHIVGAKAMAVMNAIDARAALATSVGVELHRNGSTLVVSVLPPAQQEPLTVQLVRYRPKATVDILRGENAGRTISYSNIVTAWDDVAEWDGAEPLTMEVAVDGEDPIVVLVQRPGHGAILGAAAAR